MCGTVLLGRVKPNWCNGNILIVTRDLREDVLDRALCGRVW